MAGPSAVVETPQVAVETSTCEKAYEGMTGFLLPWIRAYKDFRKTFDSSEATVIQFLDKGKTKVDKLLTKEGVDKDWKELILDQWSILKDHVTSTGIKPTTDEILVHGKAAAREIDRLRNQDTLSFTNGKQVLADCKKNVNTSFQKWETTFTKNFQHLESDIKTAFDEDEARARACLKVCQIFESVRMKLDTAPGRISRLTCPNLMDNQSAE